MSFFKNLTGGFKLSSLMGKSIKDGYLSQGEAQEIFDFAKANDINAQTVKPILITNFNKLAKNIVVNDEQHQIISQIIEYFDIQNQEIPLLSTKLNNYMADLVQSKESKPIEIKSPIILQDNERCYFVLDVYTKKEKVVSKNIRGGSAGVSVRVAKGVTLRTGNFGGTVTNNTQMVKDSAGKFIITNKRVIYKSDSQNFECDLNKLLSYQIYNDGIEINPRKGKSWQLYANHQFSFEYLSVIFDYVLNPKNDFNKHIEIIKSYDDDGNLHLSVDDELFRNYEQAMAYKNGGDFVNASELLEKSTNPPSIYHGHYEQLFIIYRKFYKDDLKNGDYIAVIDRIQKMLKMNDEMVTALNKYWQPTNSNFNGSIYSKINIIDLKTLLKAGQAIGNKNAIETAERLIQSF